MIHWFLFDLGNTVIKLAYERVIENICAASDADRDQVVEAFDRPGGYRDLERGLATFTQFFNFMKEHTGYRGSIREFYELWANFFDGAMPAIEDLLDRVRQKYRVAFLSNSNEVHAEVIPIEFAALFRPDDRFIFSHRFKVAKPDLEIFQRAIETIGAKAGDVVFVDDLIENVLAARSTGMRAFQYIDTPSLTAQLEEEGLL
ncbi:MAG TPA: HAD family phosphatase [Thermoanaerobaculia bacterium]|nr:HAD family phosphatase [Thermoanaerobaculia bacterium]